MAKKKVEYATKEELEGKEISFGDLKFWLGLFLLFILLLAMYGAAWSSDNAKRIDALNQSRGEVYEKCREAGLTNYFYKRTNGCDVPKDTNLFNSPFLTTTHDEGEIFNQTFDVYYSGKPFHYNCEYKKTGEKIMFCTKPLLCEKVQIYKDGKLIGDEECWEKPKQETELKEKEHQTYTECRNKDLCYSLIRRRCVSC